MNDINKIKKHFLKNDSQIHSLIIKYDEIKLKMKRNYFFQLCTSIIEQQLSVQSASAINKRFQNHFSAHLTPKDICKTSKEKLRSLGISNAKVIYINDLAEKILSKEVNLNGISKCSDKVVIEELTKVKGIGLWTAHMFLIFVLARKNILPDGDLGIKKAIMLNYSLKNLPTGEEVIKISSRNNWAPYNSYVSLYLWKSIGEE